MLIPNIVMRGPEMWHICTVRKPHECCKCLSLIRRGDKAYRPLTKNNNSRFCINCIKT